MIAVPGTGIDYKSLGQEARRSPLTRLNEKAKKREVSEWFVHEQVEAWIRFYKCYQWLEYGQCRHQIWD